MMQLHLVVFNLNIQYEVQRKVSKNEGHQKMGEKTNLSETEQKLLE